jgi:predicted transcriptional regulator
MASNTTGATKLNAQLEIAAIEYAGETKLVKLRKNNGWNFTSSSKRGRLEIMAEILCYCSQQKAKTDIMYKANLNYTQLKKHLKSLTSRLAKDQQEQVCHNPKGVPFSRIILSTE